LSPDTPRQRFEIADRAVLGRPPEKLLELVDSAD